MNNVILIVRRCIMKKNIGIVLSFLAAVCFFISYFLDQDFIYLTLGFTWVCIGFGNVANARKKK